MPEHIPLHEKDRHQRFSPLIRVSGLTGRPEARQPEQSWLYLMGRRL